MNTDAYLDNSSNLIPCLYTGTYTCTYWCIPWRSILTHKGWAWALYHTHRHHWRKHAMVTIVQCTRMQDCACTDLNCERRAFKSPSPTCSTCSYIHIYFHTYKNVFISFLFTYIYMYIQVPLEDHPWGSQFESHPTTFTPHYLPIPYDTVPYRTISPRP